MSEWMVELDHVSKAFGGIRALVDVSLRLKAGEVHALVGENGAGKSTLMNILGGVLQPDSGEIRLNGEPVRIASPAVAQELGIGLVHQEIALCQDISVAENILMARTNHSRSLLVDYARLKARAQEVMNRLAPIPVDRRVERLSISNQQLVEIAKALTLDCRVLIFDEPTAALTETEARTLFEIIRGLKAEGISIIYISHRMAEIFELCDRVTVLRDGHYVGTDDIADVTPESVVNSMVGREITQLYPPKLDRPAGGALLTAEGLGDGIHFEDVDLELREGEILGIAGLIGSGRTEIAEGLCGLRPLTTGSVTLLGEPLKARSYADSIDRGLVYLSEDRKGSGVFLDLSIAQNISALDVDKLTVGGILLSRTAEARQAEALAKKLNIKMGGIRYPVSSLSGGNQQKVAIAKQLSVSPRVIILDEPTRGIDVGAKTEIHRLLRELAESGIGILVISSELPEVLGLCDRVLVISEGRVAGELGVDDMSEEAIIHLASGLKQTDNNASTKANPHAAQ